MENWSSEPGHLYETFTSDLLALIFLDCKVKCKLLIIRNFDFNASTLEVANIILTTRFAQENSVLSALAPVEKKKMTNDSVAMLFKNTNQPCPLHKQQIQREYR